MFIDFLCREFKNRPEAEAVIWEDRSHTYGWLHDSVTEWQEIMTREGLPAGSVVVLEADFSPNSIALFLSLLGLGLIVVPLTPSPASHKDELIRISQGEVLVTVGNHDEVKITHLNQIATHELYSILRQRGHPGLVLFSSGSTGGPKAAVHDFLPLLEKFKAPRKTFRTIPFLLYDHIGGINTMLYTLANCGCLVIIKDRTPDNVLSAVDRHKVELLPCSPTFLNLILIGRAFERYDASSLKIVSYGTEPIQESTLRLFREIFPHVDLVQTYGLSEIGILRSKSQSADSPWVRIGGEGVEIRIQDGILQIKARSAMLGYLNAPSPFTMDGWFNTGDHVEVDGEYLRILGRDSEIINVGGQKVYPAEVESVILEMDNIADVTVYGQDNPITGQIVCAMVTPHRAEMLHDLAPRLKKFCREKLESYKIPVKIRITESLQHGARFKRTRRIASN